MNASRENPVYSIYIQSGSYKFNLTPIYQSLSFSDREKQMSKSAEFDIIDINVNHERKILSKILKVGDPVWIYADDGERNEEVWRGTVWTWSYAYNSDEHIITLKCYDNLIYFQESEESEYFSAGKSTETIVRSLCNKWGVGLEYTYSSITHSKLALRGTLSDIFTDDILDTVKKQIGKKYVILSEKGVMKVKHVGDNATIYKIHAGDNASSIGVQWTMDGVISKVVILGKADDNDRRPVEATVEGDVANVGTLQKLMNRDENTSLEAAKAEAQSIINEKGAPWWEMAVTAPDIPWIRKGDKIHVKGGGLDEYFIVWGIDRDISRKKKTMTLTFKFE